MRYQGERLQCSLAEEPFKSWNLPAGAPWAWFYRYGIGFLIRFPGLADFEVSHDGESVMGWTAPGVTSETLENLYLNQVHPLALSRQGKLVLHASAVALSGFAVAFVGRSGMGKSTLAASFATSGYPFLADDGLDLDWRDGTPFVTASHPSIRLWEDSRSMLADGAYGLAPAISYTTKSRLLAGPDLVHADHDMPLHSIFILGDEVDEAPTIQAMTAGSAVLEILRHSFLLDVSEKEGLAQHFEEITRLATGRGIHRLCYPRNYERLPQVRDAIISHVNRVRSSP